MAKKQKKQVWIVTLPNGRRQEIDEQVAQKYFLSDVNTTPFSHLTLDKVVKLRPVTTPPPPVEPQSSPSRKARARRVRPMTSRRPRRARRLQSLRTAIRASRSAAARRLRRR